MKRHEFIRNALFGTGWLAAAVASLQTVSANRNVRKYQQQPDAGSPESNHINHTKTNSMANSVLHPADSRGDANHGWLHSKHTFSFSDYFNPERMQFGALRVLNDDIVNAAMGFGRHPHNNMEIISIPLEGELEHKDSMGNVAVIRKGDIQVMSAGTGVEHSEHNKSLDKPVKFLQIWVFPNKQNVTPRYDQISLNPADRKNTLQQILSPDPNDAGVWIHQDAWFHLADFDKGTETQYTFNKNGNGLYVFVLDGDILVEEQVLHTRDGFGIWNTNQVNIKAQSNAEFLLMEVPMQGY